MYENNSKFIKAFSAYFADGQKFKIMQNGVSLLSGWKYCEGDTKKFFKYINIQDKLILYKWVASNSLVLCNDMEILSAISLD